jgi:hypothetical protein
LWTKPIRSSLWSVLAFITNIRLLWEWLRVINTLAYYVKELITAEKVLFYKSVPVQENPTLVKFVAI